MPKADKDKCKFVDVPVYSKFSYKGEIWVRQDDQHWYNAVTVGVGAFSFKAFLNETIVTKL